MLSQVVAKNKVMVSIFGYGFGGKNWGIVVEKYPFLFLKKIFSLRDRIRKTTYNTTLAPRRSGPSPRAERANSRAAALRNAPR